MTLNSPSPELLNLLSEISEDLIGEVDPHYLEEPRGLFEGRALAVLRPRSTAEVASILTLCNQAKVGVIPYAGGTGLVGGQVSATGEKCVILSMERMNAIREFSDMDQSMVVEAGAILSEIHSAADEKDLLFPLSLASEGSCRIGGNLATNAGGVNVLRWGNTRDLCLGVEAVLADGTIHHGLKSLRKDNTGYDLRHLMIGSEGTLGIITAARLRLFPQPKEVVTALLDVASPEIALILLRRLQTVFGEMISAFELIDRTGLDFLNETMPDLPLPPTGHSKWLALIEVGGGLGSMMQARFEQELGAIMEEGLVSDGHIAQSESQRQTIWQMRESIPEANRLVGAISSHDISVPINRIPEFVREGRKAVQRLNAGFRVNCFGHLGDGNLHYNVYPPKGRKKAEFANMRVDVKDTIHSLVHSFEGSISAEHGIGRLKRDDLVKFGDPGKLVIMRSIKSALDPNGIMNPGAVLTD